MLVHDRDFFFLQTILNYLMFDLEGPQCETRSLTGSNSPTIQSRLEQTKKELEARLTQVNAGLAALKANPELATALETLTKAIRA